VSSDDDSESILPPDMPCVEISGDADVDTLAPLLAMVEERDRM
jgi:hypothetical protein